MSEDFVNKSITVTNDGQQTEFKVIEVKRKAEGLFDEWFGGNQSFVLVKNTKTGEVGVAASFGAAETAVSLYKGQPNEKVFNNETGKNPTTADVNKLIDQYVEDHGMKGDFAKTLIEEGAKAAASDAAFSVIEGGEEVMGDADNYNKVMKEVDDRVAKAQADFLDKLSGYGAQSFFMENITRFVEKATKSPGSGGSRNYLGYFLTMEPNDPNSKLKLASMFNPADLMHTFHSQKAAGAVAFQKGTPVDYSLLVPEVTIFVTDPSGNEYKVPFSNYIGDFTTESILASRDGRGDDVGFLELNWNYYSNDAGTATRAEAGELQLKLYFQNGASIFKNRTLHTKDGKKYSFNFSDFLNIRAKERNDDEQYLYDTRTVRIVAGYNYDRSTVSQGSSADFFNAAGAAKKSFTCSGAQSYELDIQEDGSIIITFDYHFYSSSIVKDGSFDIFDNKKVNQALNNLRKLKDEKAAKAEKKESDTDAAGGKPEKPKGEDAAENKLNDSLEAAKEAVQTALSDVYSSIRNSILARTYKVSLPQGHLENYLLVRQSAKGKVSLPTFPDGKGGTAWHWDKTAAIPLNRITSSPFSARDAIPAGTQGVEDAGEEKANKEADSKTTPKEEEARSDTNSPGDADGPKNKDKKASATGLENLHLNESGRDDIDMFFVYFGDLLAAFMEQPACAAALKEQNYTVVLGQVMMSDVLRGADNTFNPEGIAVNLGDVPIALDTINEWFTNVFVEAKIRSMTFEQLIYSLITRLLNNIFNNPDTIHGPGILRTRSFSTGYVTSKKPRSVMLPHGRNKLMGSEDFAHLTSKAPSPKKNRHNYLVLASNPEGFVTSSGATEEADAALGIYHYYLSRDKGLLKKCSFAKESMGPEIRVMNVAAAASDPENKGLRFWEPYNVTVELFGQPYFEPYQKFFLNPTLPGMGSLNSKDSPAYKLQIGGYYSSMTIKNTITQTSWSTEVGATKASGDVLPTDPDSLNKIKLIKHKPLS